MWVFRQLITFCFFLGLIASPPTIQHVQFLLGEVDGEDPCHESHPLFSEMEELITNKDGELEWKETARYGINMFKLQRTT
jgi:hypothetical protein